MKKSNIALLLMSLLLIGFSNCKKETEPPTERFSINKEKEKVLPMTTSVTITGEYTFSGKVKSMKLKLGTNENLFGSDEYAAELANKSYSAAISGLSPGTLYYYRYLVDYGDDIDFESDIYDFTTLSEVPIVKALEVVAIDSTTFRIKCEALSDGGSEVTERGICWNNFGDPGMDDDTLRYSTGGIGQYTIRMENLDLGKKYYVRAYAKSSAGIGLSEEVLNFETVAPSGVSVDIELSCNPEEGGTVNGGGSYEVGTQCTATAVANTGYTFVNWTENGVQVSSDAQYTFTVTTGRSLVANFTMQDYIITAEVDPENSGIVTGAGGYNYGEQCTLTATAMTGYDFVKWTKGGTTVSTNAEYSFTVTATATYVAHFSIKSYSVSVSANPSNGGTVTGGGTFNYGESRTVHATPANGFAFTNWTDDGDEVSTDADYTFTVSSNRNLVANFTVLQPNEYSVTVSANPSEGGTVTGSGTYQQGQSCTVKATSKPNFTFVNWTENGNQVSDLAEYTFTVTGNRVLVANFEAQAPTEYTVSVSANPSNGGTVTGGGTFQQGQQCTVTATANEGYNFTNWTEGGNVVSTQASYTFTVNSNRNLVANFSQQSYTINASASPSNGGTVSGAGNYNYGQSCTLSATAANGYTFTNWTENGNQVSTNANYTFTVTGNRTLVANFAVQAPNTYTINVSANPSTGGTVTGGGSYNQGASCTVTATANTGYTFLKWTENGNQVSTNANYTFTVTGNRTLVAQFEVQSYTINASANPTNGGSVSGGGSYDYGQSCTLTATAATGYTFLQWTENGNQVSTNANYTFTVTGNRTLVAQFQVQSYTITASANPSNGGSVSGGGNYNYGQSCTVQATANTGYTFTNWTENGSVVSSNANYTFTVTSNRTLVANFTVQGYTINVSANPSNGGSISGGGTYNYGQSCTVSATANSGYTFTNWTENGNVVSTNANYTFTVTSNRTLVANFTESQPPIGAINGLFTINANGDQVYFSQGNLQYIGSAGTPYWKFADNQWDYLGTTTGQNSPNIDVDRDLFGWGTSGWNSGANCYQPWSTSENHYDYYPGGSYANNLTGSYANADWGQYNAIINGGNQAGLWRTLTISEWRHVLIYRNTTYGIHYAKAQVADVNGLILLPDNWSPSTYSLANPDNSSASFSSNVISATQWTTLENAGAVFLPAAGGRSGTSLMNLGSYGTYWSATAGYGSEVGAVRFRDNILDIGGYYRYFGYSVRVVQDY